MSSLIHRAANLHTHLSHLEWLEWRVNWSRAKKNLELLPNPRKYTASDVWNWGMARWSIDFSYAEYNSRETFGAAQKRLGKQVFPQQTESNYE
jgi:hypothetical protein